MRMYELAVYSSLMILTGPVGVAVLDGIRHHLVNPSPH